MGRAVHRQDALGFGLAHATLKLHREQRIGGIVKGEGWFIPPERHLGVGCRLNQLARNIARRPPIRCDRIGQQREQNIGDETTLNLHLERKCNNIEHIFPRRPSPTTHPRCAVYDRALLTTTYRQVGEVYYTLPHPIARDIKEPPCYVIGARWPFGFPYRDRA